MTTKQLRRTGNRRDFLRAIGSGSLIVATGGLMTGCGGGDGVAGNTGNNGGLGGSGGSGGTGNGGGGTSQPGSGTPGTPLTEAQRMVAIKAVNTQIDTLLAQNKLTVEPVLAYLKTRPEFSALGSVKPGGAWARFTDGHLMVISFNLPPDVPITTRGVTPAPTPAIGRAVNSELPTLDRARIMNGLGTAFLPPHDDISLWLVKHGYTRVASDLSIESLKNVNSDGVFYVNSHGDYGKLADGTEIWGMWTSDVVTADNNVKYANLLSKGAVIFFTAIHNKAPIQIPFSDEIRGNSETHYAITHRFLDEYNWQFGPNSFVYLNCCWSGDEEFRKKCLARGASVYAGWNNAVVPSGAWRAARFLFDRLLGQKAGSNQEYPEPDGLQRPFDATAVKKDLNGRGWNVTNSPVYGQATLAFLFDTGKNDFGLLAPSIQYVDVDERADKLTLTGLFGSNTAANARFVTVGGKELPILSWAKEKIECKLPKDATGDVEVRVGVRRSNVRQLSQWQGRFDYTAVGPGTLKQVMAFTFRFRADIGKFREQPAGPLKDRIVMFTGVNDGTSTKGTYLYSGQRTQDLGDGNGYFFSWNANGEFIFPGLEVSGNGMAFFGSIDTATRQMKVTPVGLKANAGTLKSYLTFRGAVLGGSTDADFPLAASTSLESYDSQEGTARYLVLTMDSQFGFPADKREKQVDPVYQIEVDNKDKLAAKWVWNAIPCQNPPRTDVAR